MKFGGGPAVWLTRLLAKLRYFMRTPTFETANALMLLCFWRICLLLRTVTVTKALGRSLLTKCSCYAFR